MASLRISTKRLQIDKANQTVLLVTSLAAFVTIFSIFVSRALLAQRAYQAKVIAGKEAAYRQLEANIKSVDTLTTAYKEFADKPVNIIGGQAKGTGDRDGDNAKIVLDALPSKYDFPALTASLEKLLKGYTFDSISGNDDEVNQAAAAAGSTGAPVPIPFTVGVTGNYGSMQSMLVSMENSIRPIQVGSLTFSGSDNNLRALVTATTYYQPEKKLSITMKDVR